MSHRKKSDESQGAQDGKATGERGGGHSICELTQRNVKTIAELEKAASDRRGYTDRFADAITRFVGSMGFVYFHVVWYTAWIVFNSLPLVPEPWRVDPFPFTFLTFVVSLEAIFLSTFILISQNHEERMALRRSHLDLQVTLLSEQENSKMLEMLETIQRKLDIAVDGDTRQLEEDAQPAELVREIDESLPQAK
jgi:uncharacterized membrane protein